jgi:hypothetical protein
MDRHSTLGRLALALLLPVGFLSQQSQLRAADDKLDKKVVEIVKQTGALYKDAKTMHAEGVVVTKSEGGDTPEVKLTSVYDVEKPMHFSLKTKINGDATKGPDVIADGKKMFVYRKAQKKYIEQDSPDSLAAIGLGLLGLGQATGMLFANIMGPDPADQLMEGVFECTYAGLDKIDGKPVHRMKFKQNEFDWELWVASEGKPYILRMINTREGPNGKFTTTETYSNWKLDAPIAKETFTFKAPEGATKVDDFGQPAK